MSSGTRVWLGLWADRIDLALGLYLPAVRIAVENLPARTLGEYRYRPRLVVMNRRRLSRPAGDVLGTLTHELLHAHFHAWAGDDVGHGPAFRDRAAAAGLLVTPEGYTSYADGPFFDLLRRHGVSPPS